MNGDRQSFVKVADPTPVAAHRRSVNTSVTRRDILLGARSPAANRADRLAAQAITIIRIAVLLTLIGGFLVAVR